MLLAYQHFMQTMYVKFPSICMPVGGREPVDSLQRGGRRGKSARLQGRPGTQAGPG